MSPLQTHDPVSLVLLHGAVPKTNSKQLGEAIMSSIEWSGSNIPIFVKEDLFKASLNEVVTGEKSASGQVVWVAGSANVQENPQTGQEEWLSLGQKTECHSRFVFRLLQ